MKIVKVKTEQRVQLEYTQVLILCILVANNKSLAYEYAKSICSLAPEQIKILLQYVNKDSDLVCYGIETKQYEITDAEYALVQHLYTMTEWNNGVQSPAPRKISAVKFIRQQYGLDLKEAKDLCDTIAAE